MIRGPFPELLITPAALPMSEAVTEEALREHAERELADLVTACAQVSPQTDVRPRIGYGHPTAVLNRVAEEADLLVVGSSGRTGLPRALLGSVARGSRAQQRARSSLSGTTRSTVTA